jgi:endonuclease YncB( thermonuclease family)
MSRISTPAALFAASAACAVVALAAQTGLPVSASTVRPHPADVRPADPMPDMPLRAIVPVDVLRVIDGDTVEVRAHVWLEQSIVTRVRLKAIDAPELRSGCPAEIRQAEAAKAEMTRLLAEGRVFLASLGRDKYGGRVLGELLTSQGKDIGQAMLASGHARRYAGGKRERWC